MFNFPFPFRGRFKRVDQTTKPNIHEWVYRNSLSTATAQNKPTEVTNFSHPSKKASYTTITCREGEMDYSSDAIQFENCMCEFDFRGKLTDSAFGICMSLVSTGCVDIDHRLTMENRYTHYTLLGIAIDTDDMEKAIELLHNGADPCVRILIVILLYFSCNFVMCRFLFPQMKLPPLSSGENSLE